MSFGTFDLTLKVKRSTQNCEENPLNQHITEVSTQI